MTLFRNLKDKLAPVKDVKFDLEKNLQTLVEQNMQEVFGLEFVATEFQLENYYIDTLAFDPEAQAFVIIEYKRDKSFSVVDQGMHYLSLMFNHKADCLLELGRLKGKFIDKKSIDWSQSKVIFAARNFTPYQIGSVGFKDFPIELWQATMYEGGLIDLTKIQASKTGESITKITKSKEAADIARQVEEVDVSEHRGRGNKTVEELFDTLRERILELDSRIIENPVKNYIGYKFHGTNIVSLNVKSNKIVVDIRSHSIHKNKLPINKRRQRGWDATPSWGFNVSKPDEIRDAFDYIEQAYTHYQTRYS
jgi:predicted transport protein